MEDKYKYIFIFFISMCILNFLVIPLPIYQIPSENITIPTQSTSPPKEAATSLSHLQEAVPLLNNIDCHIFRDQQLRCGPRGCHTGEGRCSECISKIIDGLYLGDIRCASNLKILKLHNIKYILNVTDDIPFFFKNNFEYARIPIKDKPDVDISVFFNHSSSYIENRIRDGNIFIHCYAGISRSSSIVIAYLIIKKKYSYNDAYNLVKSKRPCIRPNKGFDYLLSRF